MSDLVLHARLVPGVAEEAEDLPGSWYITHGFGRPAANTYTEVAFAPEVQFAEHPSAVLDRAVRQVAEELYGPRWSFLYGPQERAESIDAYRAAGLRRRERVLISTVEVYE